MILNKQNKLKHAADSLTRRHHFSNQNTFEIILTLLFISIITRLVSILSRDARY